MAKARVHILLDKSIAAAISAIEIYNKPDFKYREETFSILMINAWELLLKAKILKDNKNQLNSIYIPEKTKTKEGKPLKRFYPKLNRSKNPLTIEINGALEKLKIEERLKENIKLLVEIRDNSIHFINDDKFLSKKILEIGTANVKSFTTICGQWFDKNLSQYNFYLMPISFFHTYEIESFSINDLSDQNKKLIEYIKNQENIYPSDESNEHNISLKLVTKFEKSSSIDSLKVCYSDNANISVKIDSEEQFAKKYPMSFSEITQKLSSRYSNWKKNNNFWALLKKLKSEEKFAKERFLNPETKKTGQWFYSTEIFKEFDKYYRK